MNPFLHPHTPTGTLSILRGSVRLRIADIVRLEGDGNYTRIILANGRKIMTSRNLSFYEPLLTEIFVRVHKQTILNRLYIARFDKKQVVMQDGFVVQVARRKSREVNKIIKF